MTTDEAARDALAHEARRARLHSRALRAESLRLLARSRRVQEQCVNLRLIALLRLAAVRQGVAPPA